jgi:PAS domain-containing protein
MTQHTTGPWATSKGAYGALHVGPAKLDHPGREAAQYAAERGRDLLAQREADAALIAAAPDMLAVLQAIAAFNPGAAETIGYDTEDMIANIQGICRAIITKAKGGAA